MNTEHSGPHGTQLRARLLLFLGRVRLHKHGKDSSSAAFQAKVRVHYGMQGAGALTFLPVVQRPPRPPPPLRLLLAGKQPHDNHFPPVKSSNPVKVEDHAAHRACHLKSNNGREKV